MDLPIKFPSETEVILEEVARFRALSPRERVDSLGGLILTGEHLSRISPKREWARQYAEQEKRLTQASIREFIARHAR
jgi:hypothetical protein